ncbi:MAG: hydrogenase expression/formation protein HypE [Paenibacillus sp.]|jgi:hydrogenase expression/formation protein HypE|nr:hydrogenase expression/formation protein HypE [Paenibacillus sp.]
MKTILLSHGDGGQLTQELIEDVFRPLLKDPCLQGQSDSAICAASAPYMAVSTDTFVIQPLEFPGGDIGKLAVAGTVNDIAVCGAKPVYITAGFVLEEGMECSLLRRLVESMARTAVEAGVRIIAGDTKVVERGMCGGMIINTTGIGFMNKADRLGFAAIRPGDRVIINGGIAEHAVAVLAERAGLEFASPLLSDCRPLNGLIERLLERFPSIRFMRDPTRGGIATTLKEIAGSLADQDIWLEEERIPLEGSVRGALEMLGMDPLYMANEGKVLMIASAEDSTELVQYLRSVPGNELASVIGTVKEGRGRLLLHTRIGGTRELGKMSGAPLPRIC